MQKSPQKPVRRLLKSLICGERMTADTEPRFPPFLLWRVVVATLASTALLTSGAMA